jgi:hypothetical protein
VFTLLCFSALLYNQFSRGESLLLNTAGPANGQTRLHLLVQSVVILAAAWKLDIGSQAWYLYVIPFKLLVTALLYIGVLGYVILKDDQVTTRPLPKLSGHHNVRNVFFLVMGTSMTITARIFYRTRESDGGKKSDATAATALRTSEITKPLKLDKCCGWLSFFRFCCIVVAVIIIQQLSMPLPCGFSDGRCTSFFARLLESGF